MKSFDISKKVLQTKRPLDGLECRKTQYLHGEKIRRNFWLHYKKPRRIQKRYVAVITKKLIKPYSRSLVCKEVNTNPLMAEWLKRKHCFMQKSLIFQTSKLQMVGWKSERKGEINNIVFILRHLLTYFEIF